MLPALYKDPHEQRRVATLYWKRGKDEAFLVLSEHSDKPVSGEPIKLDQIGVHHFAFWVDDLPAVYEELKGKGAGVCCPTFSSPRQPTAFFIVRFCATRMVSWSS